MTQTVGSGTRPKLGPDYWRLWWANAISSTGDGAFVAALPLLAVTITRDPRLVSVVTAATYLPWMVLSLPAGVLVDRYDRATLMWRSQAVQAAVVTVVAILVVFRQADIAVLSVAGLLLGSAEVIFSNAAQSVLPALVPPELLAKANGSQQVSLTVGESFLGPPAGSLLFAAAAALPFGLDAASFAGSAALLARLPRTGLPRTGLSRTEISGTGRSPRLRTQIAEGLRWLARHRLLRVVAVLLGVYNFANQMGQAILVLLATVTLHLGTRGYGFLLAATAVGSVAGGLLAPGLTRRLGMLPSLITGGGDRRRRLRRHRAGAGPGRRRGDAGRAGFRRHHVERRHGQPAPADRAVPPARPGQQRLPHARLGPDAARRAGRRVRRARRGAACPVRRRRDPLRPVHARRPPVPARRRERPGLRNRP